MSTQARGFTLIEVVVALAILAGGIVMISMAWSGNLMHVRKAALFNDVATLLERKMVEIEAKYKERPLGEIPDEDSGEFEDHPRYRWEMKSREMKFPDLTPLIVGQGQENANEMLLGMIKQMIEYLNKTIKEVKVSIFVKPLKGKELEFSASQYFIDYNRDFAGAAGGTTR